MKKFILVVKSDTYYGLVLAINETGEKAMKTYNDILGHFNWNAFDFIEVDEETFIYDSDEEYDPYVEDIGDSETEDEYLIISKNGNYYCLEFAYGTSEETVISEYNSVYEKHGWKAVAAYMACMDSEIDFGTSAEDEELNSFPGSALRSGEPWLGISKERKR